MNPKITIDVQIDDETSLVIERKYPKEDPETIRDFDGEEVRRYTGTVVPKMSADAPILAQAVSAALSIRGLQ